MIHNSSIGTLEDPILFINNTEPNLTQIHEAIDLLNTSYDFIGFAKGFVPDTIKNSVPTDNSIIEFQLILKVIVKDSVQLGIHLTDSRGIFDNYSTNTDPLDPQRHYSSIDTTLFNIDYTFAKCISDTMYNSEISMFFLKEKCSRCDRQRKEFGDSVYLCCDGEEDMGCFNFSASFLIDSTNGRFKNILLSFMKGKKHIDFATNLNWGEYIEWEIEINDLEYSVSSDNVLISEIEGDKIKNNITINKYYTTQESDHFDYMNYQTSKLKQVLDKSANASLKISLKSGPD